MYSCLQGRDLSPVLVQNDVLVCPCVKSGAEWFGSPLGQQRPSTGGQSSGVGLNTGLAYFLSWVLKAQGYVSGFTTSFFQTVKTNVNGGPGYSVIKQPRTQVKLQLQPWTNAGQ